MVTSTKRKTREQMIQELERSQPAEIAGAEKVTGARNLPPFSVRLSAQLLEALDRLAQAQHRKRGNLIQHILWEYVEANDRSARR